MPPEASRMTRRWVISTASRSSIAAVPSAAARSCSCRSRSRSAAASISMRRAFHIAGQLAAHAHPSAHKIIALLRDNARHSDIRDYAAMLDQCDSTIRRYFRLEALPRDQLERFYQREGFVFLRKQTESLLGAVFGGLIVLNRLRVMALTPYLLGGALMWYLMLRSGIHATIAGVLLAFAIPFSARAEDEQSPSHRLEHLLHKPVAFLILPIFALANTGIVIGDGWLQELASDNSAGIIGGLVVGKPLGITLLSFVAVAVGVCRLPDDLAWKHIAGAGMLGGIGFTMSIFITNLAFHDQPAVINASKMAILVASLAAGTLGYAWLRFAGKQPVTLSTT